jgi:hypothetical protein
MHDIRVHRDPIRQQRHAVSLRGPGRARARALGAQLPAVRLSLRSATLLGL